MSKILELLKQASADLRWSSESDYAFEPFAWEATTFDPKTVKEKLGLNPNAPVETMAIDDFFAPVIEAQDWFGEEETAAVNKYKKLVDTLKTNLSDIAVYRLGSRPEIDICIVGKTASGNLAGVSTKSVET